MEKKMEELREICLGCEKCELCKTRHNVVFGVGNINADIMFVGEGPGEQEDLKGEPFVGKSGQLLDKYLEVFGLDRHRDIYIANIIKCRPPHNRDPKPEEQELCIGYLREQVKIISPKIIVCLGRIAAQRLIDPEFRISRQHGQFFTKGKLTFMATYHPSALLRNSGNKPDALEDFQALRDWCRENLG